MSSSEETWDDDRSDRASDGSGGQVSEVSLMDGAQAQTPIQPDQAVGGSPDDEPGKVDEGAQGPDASPSADEH